MVRFLISQRIAQGYSTWLAFSELKVDCPGRNNIPCNEKDKFKQKEKQKNNDIYRESNKLQKNNDIYRESNKLAHEKRIQVAWSSGIVCRNQYVNVNRQVILFAELEYSLFVTTITVR